MTRSGRRDDDGTSPSSDGTPSDAVAPRGGGRTPTRTRSTPGGREVRDPSAPLRASRDPSRRPRAVPAPPRWRTWAIYVVPLLVVVTVLALVQSVGTGTDESGEPLPAGPEAGGPPSVGEAPPGAATGLTGELAALPPGGEFPVEGTGAWRVVPGTREPAGTGELLTYTVEVEEGAGVPEGDEAFATTVDATLYDPRSWIGSGQIAVQRIDASSPTPPDFRVSLTSQATTRAECGFGIPFDASCWRSDIGRVVINGARWVRGAVAFDGQLGLYRQYAINHEVGHVFRNPHVPCPGPGQLAPLMMQQSFGTSNDYLASLVADNPQGGERIPADGATCLPNAWPYPGGPLAAPAAPPPG